MLEMSKKRVVPEASDEPYGFVYFLSHGTSGPIKVGFTANRNAESRMQQLQIGSPETLELIGTIRAYPSIERAIHTFLGPHLVRGEWFEREPVLMLLSRLQMNSTFHQSDFVMELATVLIERAPPRNEKEASSESLAVRVAEQLLGDWVDQLFLVNTEKPLPFRAWLQAQTERKDPIGDLALDVAKDPKFPVTGALVNYLQYVTGRDVFDAVTRTLIDAWIECDRAVASLTIREQDVWDWEKNT
jgi:T5orf172 domain